MPGNLVPGGVAYVTKSSAATENPQPIGTNGSDRRRPAVFVRSSSEVGRTDLAARRMTTSLVIKHFDVIEQLHLGLADGGRSDRQSRSSPAKRTFQDGRGEHRRLLPMPDLFPVLEPFYKADELEVRRGAT